MSKAPPDKARSDAPSDKARSDAPSNKARSDAPPDKARFDAPLGRLRSDAPPVDVVIVSFNQRQRLLDCLASARAASGAVRLIVVDNASEDGSAEGARQRFPDAEVLAMGANLGFAAAVNRGVAAGRAPHILLLNNDARLQPGALEALREALCRPKVGAAGPRLTGAGGEVELSLGRTLSPWNEAWFRLLGALYRGGRGPAAAAIEAYYGKDRLTRSLTGACILMKREAFDEVGGFDERFFLYAEDVDLCIRLRRRGWKLAYAAGARVAHDRGASSATRPSASALHYRRSQLAFYRKHHGALAAGALRLYLAVRFATARLLARGERRKLAAELLRWTLREAGR
jgi:GT2 family glycosyltransferase